MEKQRDMHKKALFTIINCDTNCGTSKSNSAESAQGIYPSQGVNIRELREQEFKAPKEDNEMLQAQASIAVVIFVNCLQNK